MSAELRFDGKVAVITGAGNGLGKAYALLLASRGAHVVVNDLGGGLKGEAADKTAIRPADAVVDLIKAAGGSAVANYDSVIDGNKIIKQAVDAFGTVDILINNAGILRDQSMKRMTEQNWQMIMDIHLNAVFRTTKAAWDVMYSKEYGRIINVCSPAGLYGNVGQANYSTAKLGQLAFGFTLAKEGAKKNIRVNTIAPLAGTRMLATVAKGDLLKALSVDYVSPLVCYLCHESCEQTGQAFEVGGGYMAKVQWARSPGHSFDITKGPITIEMVQDKIGAITDMSSPDIVENASFEAYKYVGKL